MFHPEGNPLYIYALVRLDEERVWCLQLCSNSSHPSTQPGSVWDEPRDDFERDVRIGHIVRWIA